MSWSLIANLRGPAVDPRGTYLGTGMAACTERSDAAPYAPAITESRHARLSYKLTRPVDRVRLVYQGWTTQTVPPYEAPAAAPTTVSASVEFPAGKWRIVDGSTAYKPGTRYDRHDQVRFNGTPWVRVAPGVSTAEPSLASGWLQVRRFAATFNGEKTGVIPPGGKLVTDEIDLGSVTDPELALFFMVNTVAAGPSMPPLQGSQTQRLDQVWVATAAPGSEQDPTAVWPSTLPTSLQYPLVVSPVMVLGNPPPGGTIRDARVIALIGDSITFGSGAGANDGGALGSYAWWAVEGRNWVRLSRPGGRLSEWADPANGPQRRDVLKGCTDALVNLGTNDLSGTVSVEVMKQNILRVAKSLRDQGIRVWWSTLTPQTTSTDKWVSDQTPKAPSYGPSGVWATVNQWLRDGAPVDDRTAGDPLHPICGVVDSAAGVADGAVWKPGMTQDGTHPNPAGHKAMGLAAREDLNRLLGLW